MKKNCGDSSLLIRIDERVRVLPQIQEDIKELRKNETTNHYRIKTLERNSISLKLPLLAKLIRILVGK